MLSKCIRRLSFRSIAADEKLPQTDGNNNTTGKGFSLHAPTPLKPTPASTTNTGSTWTSALWSLSPKSSQASSGDSTCPMYARVTLVTCGERYVLSVQLTSSPRGYQQDGEVVAQSSIARNISPGNLQFRLQSPCLQLDQSMDTESIKYEYNWSSGDVEKQFILTAKPGHSVQGLLGKVVIEQTGHGNRSPLFELTMVTKQQLTPSQGDLAWGAAGFRELACLLQLVDESEDFTSLASDLGFTSHEIRARLLPSTDRFAALLATYQSRGGTPAELVRAMYAASRVRGLGVVGGSPVPLARAVSQCSTLSAPGAGTTMLEEDLEELQEAALLRCSPSSGSRKRRASDASDQMVNKRAKVAEEEEEDEEVDDLCDAATLPVDDLLQGVDQDHLPPTPPATPLKRLSGSNDKQNAFSYPHQE